MPTQPSTLAPLDTNEDTFSTVVEKFQTWYKPRGGLLSLDILGRIDFDTDVTHRLPQCRRLAKPKFKRCIFAFRCYSVWVIAGKPNLTLDQRGPDQSYRSLFKWLTKGKRGSSITVPGPPLTTNASTSSACSMPESSNHVQAPVAKTGDTRGWLPKVTQTPSSLESTLCMK